MKRILVCGSNGLLGQRLARLFDGESGYEVLHTSHHRSFMHEKILVDYTQLDIGVRSDVKSLLSSYRPDIVVNAAAMTNVDACEEHREQAWRVNVTAVEHLSEMCRRIDARLVHVSTDYVFDGTTGGYSEEDRVHPINYYGKTKLAGENTIRTSGVAHTIVRSVLVYGVGVNVKNNFALWVINALSERKEIRCVDDQICNPTYVHDLASAIRSIVDRDLTGLFHVCGSETISRYDFALSAAEVFGYDRSLIRRIRSTDIRRPARRPLITSFVIDKAKTAFNYQPMNVRQGLTSMQQEMTGIILN
jgi:dTDP-4-dehydrorhamnose reductase